MLSDNVTERTDRDFDQGPKFDLATEGVFG
jgi:hypothetical protein